MYKFIKELKKGDQGQEVADFQKFCRSIKYTSILKDNVLKNLEVDGDFGDITAEIVEDIKTKALDFISASYIKEKYKHITGKDVPDEWLEINSDINPLFGMLLENWKEVQEHLKVSMEGIVLIPEPIPVLIGIKQQLIDGIIAFEKGEIGTKEETGNNDGDRVEWYQKVGSNGEVNYGGSPYCQYGQNASLIQICKKLSIPYKWDYSGYTPYAVNKGKKLKIVKGGNPNGGHANIEDIQVGDWGYVYSSERRNARHVFLVIGKKGNNVYTIEFNTNSQGGAEGNGVFNRVRPVTQVWAVVRWVDLY